MEVSYSRLVAEVKTSGGADFLYFFLGLVHRDRGLCQLCGLAVDVNAPRDTPLKPTLDHIVPKSLGGQYTVENLRVTHRFCNHKRSNGLSFTPLEYRAALLAALANT